jgi:hypothetical protein
MDPTKVGRGHIVCQGDAMKATRYVPVAVALFAWFIGVRSGVHGNDTGGMIPWSPENEWRAPALAQEHCARYRKYARATSIVRQYGYYIGFECVWSPLARP